MGVHLCYLLVAVFWCCTHLVPVTSQCAREHCSDDNSDLGVLRTAVAQIRNSVDRQERRNVDILQAMEQLMQQFNNTVEQLRQEQQRSTEQLERLINNSMTRLDILILPVEERIKALEAAAKPVAGESGNDKKRRSIQVMSLLQKFNMPELWAHVAGQFVTNGELDVSEVLSRDTLPHLIFLLSSGAASNITDLRLGQNTVFSDNAAARKLATAVGRLTKLQNIYLYDCHLTDEGLAVVADALVGGCPDITWFSCYDSPSRRQLTGTSSSPVTRLLEARPRMTINLWWWSWSAPVPSWMWTLRIKFGDRVD